MSRIDQVKTSANGSGVITAVITDVIINVRSPYLVAMLSEPYGDILLTDSVTCSIRGWKGSSYPIKGQFVQFDPAEVTQNKRGWRASTARPVTPNKGVNHETTK